MYLTELWLHENVMRNGYEIHRALWQLFPNRFQRNFLFSVVERKLGSGARVLLQSDDQPVYLDDSKEKCTVVRGSKDLSGLTVQRGQYLRFRLVANPTKKIKDQNDPDRAIRVPHIGEENKIAWLTRKFEGVARICHAESANMAPIYFSKPGHRGKIQPVLFSGLLEIEDGNEFLAMMKEGVGAAKAFGCGLIQVSRA